MTAELTDFIVNRRDVNGNDSLSFSKSLLRMNFLLCFMP